jgi:hypothetical protein
MGKVYSKHGKEKNLYGILMAKPEGKKPLGRPKRDEI